MKSCRINPRRQCVPETRPNKLDHINQSENGGFMRLPARVGDCKLRCRLLMALTRRSALLAMSALLFMPITTVMASPDVVRAVETFCAPQPTQPPVTSCSTCHSSSDNRGLNDLTVSGQWSISSATYSRFCPAIVSETPAPSTPPEKLSNSRATSISIFGLGGLLSQSSRRSIGMGRGASGLISR